MRRGFWGRMGSQGMSKINGDAYLPKWNSSSPSHERRVPARPLLQLRNRGWFRIEHDLALRPGICATSVQYGTGDQWYSGTNAFSVFYELYRTNNTPYDYSDDTLVASSGNTFKSIKASDPNSVGRLQRAASSTAGDGCHVVCMAQQLVDVRDGRRRHVSVAYDDHGCIRSDRPAREGSQER